MDSKTILDCTSDVLQNEFDVVANDKFDATGDESVEYQRV